MNLIIKITIENIEVFYLTMDRVLDFFFPMKKKYENEAAQQTMHKMMKQILAI